MGNKNIKKFPPYQISGNEAGLPTNQLPQRTTGHETVKESF